MVSVTELLKLLNKPALIYWANNLGLEGTSLKQYRDKSFKNGIDNHKKVELYLKSGIEFDESKKLRKTLADYDILGIEKNINNGVICGRYDLLLGQNNKKIVVDLKSNNKIYIDHKIQLSTYKEILNADEIAIMNFEKWELVLLDIDSKAYYEIIKRLYQINLILKNLNEKL